MRRFPHLPHTHATKLWQLISALCSIIICTSSALAQGGANSPPSDQKPGSILFFAKYTSDTIDPAREDTQFHITNSHPMSDIDAHLYFVDGSTCSVADAEVLLTPNQTASFVASDLDPGVVGYLIVVAELDGIPVRFNNLSGDAYLHQIDGTTAILPATAVARIAGSDAPLSDDGTTADLIFNGMEYERLPQTVAVSSFNSQATDTTTLVLFSPAANLLIGNTASQSIFTLVYDDTERVRSTAFNIRCYRQLLLGELRILDGLNKFVEAGHTGWIRLSTATPAPLLGATLTRGPQFNGGLNVKILTLLAAYRITVPVI